MLSYIPHCFYGHESNHLGAKGVCHLLSTDSLAEFIPCFIKLSRQLSKKGASDLGEEENND